MVENVPTYPKAEETIYNVAEIAKKVRAFIKSNYPKSKYSVQKKDNTLNVKLMKSPKMPFTDEYRRTDYDYLGSYWSVNHHSIERDERLEDWIKEEFQHIVNYANQWNWDRSDIQTDYFDVNFYWNLGIGAWNKPFEYTGAPLEPEVTSETPPSSNDPQFDVGDYIKYPKAEEYGRVIAIRAIDINNPNLGYEYSAQYPNGDIITIADIDHPVKLEGDIDDGRGRELTEMGKCQFDMELINRTTAVREFVTKYGEIIYSINKNEIICKLVEAVHKFAEYELCADELPAVAKSATQSLKDKLKKLKKK
jgi:hypothetical protein